MRVVLFSSLLLIVACGGSNKPAESPGESTSEASEGGETSAAAESSESEGGAAPAASGEASAEPAASAAPASAPPPAGPTVTGAIDGKPFAPKGGRVLHGMGKDGRLVVLLDEHGDCGTEPSSGEGVLALTVNWEDGYKVDLGSLKRGGKKGPGEVSFARIGPKGKKDFSGTFKPTGRVTVVKAPMDQNSTGKINIDLQSGDYMLSGDLDVQTCVSPKSAPAGKKKKK
jgi:hypothetical protein